MEEKQKDQLLFEGYDYEQHTQHREKAFDRSFINRYFKDYRRAYSQLRAAQFTRKFGSDASSLAEAEDAAFHARMFEIKLFISSLDSGDEKMFLYYYYIKGLTMEKCAKALGISRRSVYRLKLKSLDIALEKYRSK